jgi:hypothetical protein
LSGEKLLLTWKVISQYGYLSLPFLGVMLFLLANYWLLSKRCLNHFYLLLFFSLIPLLYVVCIVMSRNIEPDGYYWTRWIDPGTLILTIITCAALAQSVYLVTMIRGTKIFSKVVPLLLIIWFILVSNRLYASFLERRQRLSTDAKVIYKVNEKIGEWLDKYTPASSIVGVNDAGAIRYISNRETIDVVGLNNHEILFGLKNMAAFVEEMEWLAVFPVLLETSSFRDSFVPIKTFEVAPEEYTICPCPQQHRMMIFRKVGIAAEK